MEKIDILSFINQQLDYLNGTEDNIGLIDYQENQIRVYLSGREESSLSREERQILRRMRTELNRRIERRNELEMLRNRYDELSATSSFGQTYQKIDTINKVFAERKRRRLGKNITVSTTEPGVRYVETREASVNLSQTAGDDIKRAKSVDASVTIGTSKPVGRVKGDGLEIMKSIISLQAVIDYEGAYEVGTQEQINTAISLVEKMMRIAKREYDYSEKFKELHEIPHATDKKRVTVPAEPGIDLDETPAEPGIDPDETPAEPGIDPDETPAKPGIDPDETPAEPGINPNEDVVSTASAEEQNAEQPEDEKSKFQWQTDYLEKLEGYYRYADSAMDNYNELTPEEKKEFLKLIKENGYHDIEQEIISKVEPMVEKLKVALQIEDKETSMDEILDYLAKLSIDEITEKFGGISTMKLGLELISEVLDGSKKLYEEAKKTYDQIIEKRHENSILHDRATTSDTETTSLGNNENEEINEQDGSERDSENSNASSKNKNKNGTEDVKIGFIVSILATILKFLKFITQKIKPLNNFFGSIEEALYESAQKPLLNSGDLKEKKKGLFDKFKGILEEPEPDQLSENIKYVFENRKKPLFKELYSKERDDLREKFKKAKGLYTRKGQRKMKMLMINENIPEVMDDSADNVISYRTLKAFVEKAKEDGIIPDSVDFREVNIKEICEIITQQRTADEIESNRINMSAIKDIVLDKSDFNPIRDVFAEEMEKVNQELDALSPRERMERISKLIKDEKVAILVEGKNYTNIALMRTFNRVKKEMEEFFPNIDIDLEELKREYIWVRAVKANIKIIDDDNKLIDQAIVIEQLKEYQENIRKSDQAARDFQNHRDDEKSTGDDETIRESSK